MSASAISERPRSYAKARCGSVRALALEIGMRSDNLHKYVAGKHSLGMGTLLRLAEHGCNVHWLLTGKGRMISPIKEEESFSTEGAEMLGMLRREGIADPASLRILLKSLHQTMRVGDELRSVYRNIEEGE